MIKKWNQFNESKAEKPGENVTGSAKINLSDEDVNAFTDNPSLQKLISDDKVALLGNEAWYWEDDMDTKGVMDQYLEIPGTVEEEPISENSQWVKIPKYPFVIFNRSDESKSLQDKLLNELDMSWSFSSGRMGEGIQNENITYIYSNWNFDGNLLFENTNRFNNPNDGVWLRHWKDEVGIDISLNRYIWDGENLITI
jgi:hypothetical protein